MLRFLFSNTDNDLSPTPAATLGDDGNEGWLSLAVQQGARALLLAAAIATSSAAQTALNLSTFDDGIPGASLSALNDEDGTGAITKAPTSAAWVIPATWLWSDGNELPAQSTTVVDSSGDDPQGSVAPWATELVTPLAQLALYHNDEYSPIVDTTADEPGGAVAPWAGVTPPVIWMAAPWAWDDGNPDGVLSSLPEDDSFAAAWLVETPIASVQAIPPWGFDSGDLPLQPTGSIVDASNDDPAGAMVPWIVPPIAHVVPFALYDGDDFAPTVPPPSIDATADDPQGSVAPWVTRPIVAPSRALLFDADELAIPFVDASTDEPTGDVAPWAPSSLAPWTRSLLFDADELPAAPAVLDASGDDPTGSAALWASRPLMAIVQPPRFDGDDFAAPIAPPAVDATNDDPTGSIAPWALRSVVANAQSSQIDGDDVASPVAPPTLDATNDDPRGCVAPWLGQPVTAWRAIAPWAADDANGLASGVFAPLGPSPLYVVPRGLNTTVRSREN